jgi:acetylornithine/succinyldiaminopimelate/putrescine aminotransferase
MIHDFSRSLADMLGEDYVSAACRARAALTGESEQDLQKIAHEEVAFYPAAFAARQEYLMTRLGETLCPPAPDSVRKTLGAPTDGYRAAQHPAAAPLSGCGCFRLGEDGRLYFAGKSEHYHIPLGHGFPGYRLIEKAKLLGIPNATHNNTRGYVTRLLEERLISAATGVEPGTPAWDELLQKREPGVLNRVINLETGSLVVEAALKMMLARFYTMGGKKAQYEGRTPVFLVMADNDGGITAGYHGTTILAQTLRGIWPELLKKCENAYRVVPVKINDAQSIREALETWNKPPFKTAGFCHEIIMMNYSGIVLTKEYLQEAYRLCRASDTPVLCDEIQSSAWYETDFLFRQYGIHPDFVSIGKGFPGGQYPASRVLASGAFDTLEQFGALVTNGQEELASLAYLVTMEFLKENGEHVRRTGRYYHESVEALAARHPGLCAGAKGDGHMTALLFQDVGEVSGFVKRMNFEHCIDLSAQTYKANCLPVALTKLPLIVTEPMVDALVGHMEQCLREMEA